jgi:hypothetical protein
MARHDEGFGAFAAFADAACQEPVAIAPPEGPATYAIVRPRDACTGAPRIFKAGEAKRIVPRVFDGTSCVRGPAEVLVQSLGEPVSLDAFVAGHEVVEVRGPRIATIVVVAADGARVEIGAYDRQRGQPVRFDDRSSPRWVPARVAFDGAGAPVFEDAACTARVATKIAREATCPLDAALVFEDVCGRARFHELGPRRTSVFAGAACAAESAGDTFAFSIGAPIDPASFATAFVVESGTSEMLRRGFAGPAGAVALWGELIDPMSREPCEPALAIDGVIRCLPTVSAELNLFADDACSTPAFTLPVDDCSSSPRPRFVRVPTEAGARAFEVIQDASSLFESIAGECKPHVPALGSRGLALAEVDVSRFRSAIAE